MDWKAVFQSIFSRAVWEIILIVGGGAVIGVVKAKWPNYAPRVLYGAAGAACIAALLFTMTGRAILSSPPPPETTPDNIEANVKVWSENFGIAFTKASIADTYFAFMLTTRSGLPVQVARMTREKPAYLQFATTLTFAPEHQAVLGTLTKDQIDTVMQEIALELAKTRVGSAIGTVSVPQTGTNILGQQTVIVLQRAAPIVNLNEAKFSDSIDDMEFTASLVRAATSLALRRATASRVALRPATH